MHLIETYATNCGLKIDRPYILEKYFPLNIDKYITFNPYSKPAKTYDYWVDVLELIQPHLAKSGIQILQLGGKNERLLPHCLSVAGQTNINQVAYIVRNSMLHFGVDSFPVHMASSYNKKIVALYSSIKPENAGPYWGDKENQIVIEPDRKGDKPSYSLEEWPKSVNTIRPEKIAQSITDLLGLNAKFEHETLYVGESHIATMLEIIPNHVADHKSVGVDNMIVRMDFEFNEQNLAQQLAVCPCSIVTNKPINANLITQFKGRINEVVLLLEKETHSPDFVKLLYNNAIKCLLLSYESEKNIQDMKIHYMDYGVIGIKRVLKPENIKEIEGEDINNLFYKSSKFTLSNGKIYPSYAATLEDKPVDGLHKTINPVINNEDFWKEAEYFSLLKKSS
jgi:hypothetical protein